MSATETKVTPLMQQYFELQRQYPEALLLFQVGDFFELFFEDAVKVAAVLNITLTQRGQYQGAPIPLCGIPVHTLDVYLAKLVKAGFRVAICEQLEPATPGKVVQRGVTRLLTPGTLVENNLLDSKSASYFCSLFPAADRWGLVFGELLTTQIFATTLPAADFKILEAEIARFLPDEILLPNNQQGKQLQSFFKALGYITSLQDQRSTSSIADEQCHKYLKAEIQQKLQLFPAILAALDNFYTYLVRCQRASGEQFQDLHFYEPGQFLILDPATQQHLELVKNNLDGSRKRTLLELIDHSITSMGSRLIKKWLQTPLIDLETILARQSAVAALVPAAVKREKLAQSLCCIADLERVVGRIALGRGVISDYLQLKEALLELPQLQQLISQLSAIEQLQSICDMEFTDLCTLLGQALSNDREQDWVIRPGFDAELDRVRDLVQDAGQKILALEISEQAATGINSLKIRFNQVHGYYIEVTHANLHLVPDHYIRKQTLAGKERFITPDLQQLQWEIEQARANIGNLETAIFNRVKEQVVSFLPGLRRLAAALAQLDALLGLANSASAYGYTRPLFNTAGQLQIIAGRHPVVEQVLGGRFKANDLNLSKHSPVWLITGPNMGGKSTFLRQTALICILAQCGAFVPVKSANLPILDRIFTRIGASDHLTSGQSTFLVEMHETAMICKYATNRSLVILDEVGRGTSTFDGLAIAQAVVEYVYEQVGALCLFATHYHELTQLAHQHSGILNFHAASKITQDGIVLLHQILPGVADGSFGVEAAKAADLPSQVVKRAQHLLQEFGQVEPKVRAAEVIPASVNQARLDMLFKPLLNLDLDQVSPRQAYDLIYQLKQDLIKFLD